MSRSTMSACQSSLMLVILHVVATVQQDHQAMFPNYTRQSHLTTFSKDDCPVQQRDNLSECPATFDKILCWPTTQPETVVYLKCPDMPGLLDGELKAYRICGPDGIWHHKDTGFMGDGYSYYSDCYTPNSREVYEKYWGNKTLEERKFMKNVLKGARTMEIVGLCVSLITTAMSLFVFCYFRSLACPRTRIHKNLFTSLIFQIVLRIIVYVDNVIARQRNGHDTLNFSKGDSDTMYDTPVLCELMYVLIEYTKTVKFVWMFIEGLYLHNIIAMAVFSGRPNFKVFHACGWGFPAIVTTCWAITMAHESKGSRCWIAYYQNPIIWIIEAPRTAIMVINLLFLLNIIRVLIIKLRISETCESTRVKKAVKAAIILLPLLGLINFIEMIPKQDDLPAMFAHMYISYFLIGLEGFFLSLIYCFLNGEVRQTLKRQWERWRQHRLIHGSSLRRMSRTLSIFTSFTEMSSSSHNRYQSPSNHAGNSTNKRIFRGTQPSSKSTNHIEPIPENMTVFELPDVVNCQTHLMASQGLDNGHVNCQTHLMAGQSLDNGHGSNVMDSDRV